MEAKSKDVLKPFLIKNTRGFDTVILTDSGTCIGGFGIKGDSCYRLQFYFDSDRRKLFLQKIKRGTITDKSIQTLIKSIQVSSILCFNQDSLHFTTCNGITLLCGSPDNIYVIKGSKYYPRSYYDGIEGCYTKDQLEFTRIRKQIEMLLEK